MNKLFIIIIASFLICFNGNTQTVDFAISTIMQLNTEKEGFSFCSYFRKYQSLKFLFQNEESCYYKCNFDKSNADSVIIYSQTYPIYSNFSEVTMYEVNIYQYYHQLRVANGEYAGIISDLELEIQSKPELYNSDKVGTNLNAQLKDSADLSKKDCKDIVFKSFNIQSPYIFGMISTNLECSKDIFKITLTIQGSLLKNRREL